jgi:hypothetical protein
MKSRRSGITVSSGSLYPTDPSLRNDSVTLFLQQLDSWYNRLTTLTHVPLTRADVISKLISKFPIHKQDILWSHKNATYDDFKARVTRIIHARDFKVKEPTQSATSAEPPRPSARRPFDAGTKNFNEQDRGGVRGAQYPRVNATDTTETIGDGHEPDTESCGSGEGLNDSHQEN